MPLLKGSAGKATPRKAIAYITRSDKARFVDVQNLFEDEDYAEQFRQTAARFGKYTDYGERKYYHFKLSPDRADHADPFMVQEYAKACAEKMLKGCECVIATHTDTQTVHAHIIVNAVHPITGKKLHFNDADYTRLKDMANDIGEQFGFSSLDFRKKAENKRTQDERHILLKGGTSWKEELREVIEEGKILATSEEEFISHLADYGVRITRSGKDYSYLHPQKSKAIRGLKLGDNYTKTEVLNGIAKHKNGADGYPAATITGNGLLKEALAISNERCNTLVSLQNTLILDLTASVNEIKSDSGNYAKKLSESVQSTVKEIREIAQDERQFKAELSQTIESEITQTVAEAKNYALEQVDETLSEIKEQLKATAQEIERERGDMKLVHGFRKFLFWATPVLLLAQTFAMLFLIFG